MLDCAALTLEVTVGDLSGRSGAVFGRRLLDVSSVMRGEARALDAWLALSSDTATAPLDCEAAPDVDRAPCVRLCVTFDVLERCPRPGDLARLSGMLARTGPQRPLQLAQLRHVLRPTLRNATLSDVATPQLRVESCKRGQRTALFFSSF